MHICAINNWREIVKGTFDRIRSSGLYDKIDELRYGLLGNYECLQDELFHDPKFRNILWSPELDLYESCTINKLWYAARDEEEFNVLYLHSKGVRYNGTDQRITNWANYLAYFNIDRHTDCLEQLENGAHVVGVNISTTLMIHYSGNFWWSKSSYIRRSMQYCTQYTYCAPEYWITLSRDGTYVDLNDCPPNYYDGTPEEVELAYKNKPLNIKKYKYSLEITP